MIINIGATLMADGKEVKQRFWGFIAKEFLAVVNRLGGFREHLDYDLGIRRIRGAGQSFMDAQTISTKIQK